MSPANFYQASKSLTTNQVPSALENIYAKKRPQRKPGLYSDRVVHNNSFQNIMIWV